MKVSKEILNDIADSLEAGQICYLHKETLEIIQFPDKDKDLYEDMEVWQEEIDKVFDDREKYIEIKGMVSSESFSVMENFVLSLEDNFVKSRLLQAIEGHKPFANFKHQIANAGEYRELWFKFRRDRNIDWVQEQLDYDIL
ncbi:UPF0158 family protein [Flavitalea sp.]|nr:UPF0158 family protein [Flavitalea sp.]